MRTVTVALVLYKKNVFLCVLSLIVQLSSCPVRLLTPCHGWSPCCSPVTAIIIIAVSAFDRLCLLSIFLSRAVPFPSPSRRRLIVQPSCFFLFFISALPFDNDLDSFFLVGRLSVFFLLLLFLYSSTFLPPHPFSPFLLQLVSCLLIFTG